MNLFGKEIKRWGDHNCSVTMRAKLFSYYNEKEPHATCTTKFFTSTDKRADSVKSVIGEGSTEIRAIAAAKASGARQELASTPPIWEGTPVCSSSMRLASQYAKDLVPIYFCTLSYKILNK